MIEFAHRISHPKAEGAYAVSAHAQALEAQGREIIHLQIGQPDFETYPQRRGVSLTSEQVVVAPGTKLLLLLPMTAMLKPDDKVIFSDPRFPSCAAPIALVGAVPIPIPLIEERGYILDLATFDAALSPRTMFESLAALQVQVADVLE